MKTKFFAIAAVLFIIPLFASACGTIHIHTGGFRHIDGSGNVITVTRDVADFDEVSLTGFGELNITQGDEVALNIRTDDNIMPYIKTEVRNGELVLSFTKDMSYDPTEGIEFDLVVTDLNALEIAGAGSVHSNGLEAERLQVTLSGAGSLTFANLVADELKFKMSGAGSAVLSGQVQEQDVEISGAGSYEAARLESADATFEMNGIGSASLWATETLDLQLDSIGTISYYGSPRVTQSISGLGRVVSMGGG